MKHAGHTNPSSTVSDGGAAGSERCRPRPPRPKRDDAGTACGGGGRSGEPSSVLDASSVLGIRAASRSGETTVSSSAIVGASSSGVVGSRGGVTGSSSSGASSMVAMVRGDDAAVDADGSSSVERCGSLWELPGRLKF